MGVHEDARDWALQKFGVGQPVRRSEDPVLLRGEGRYTDDVDLPGQAHAVVVRSPYAHGVIRRVETEAARAMPGVLGVYTAEDLAGYGTLKCVIGFDNRDGTPMRKPPRPALARDKVRFVGDPVAFVVAKTVWQAKDAAEAVELDIEPLPAVTRAREAAAPGAPLLYDEAPGNVALDYHFGDADKVAAAFAGAAHVTRLAIVNNRVVVNPMEPRAAVASWTADGRCELRAGCQGVFGLRGQLAGILNLPPERIRVLTGHVGGSFGMKSPVYPEYVCALHAARVLARPVKWTDERSGSFLSDQHGRDHEMLGELALDREGRFLALRITGFGNMGGYLATVAPLMPTFNIVKNSISIYRTPLIEVSTKCVFTNTTPVSAYRGAGRPEANYIMERLIDTAAAELGIDPVELRRRNHVRPADLPWRAASGMVYDSGDFTAVLDRALEAADARGFAERRAESRARGKLRGLGVGSYLEVSAPPRPEMGGIRFEADGTVSLVTGTLDSGHGHATSLAQVIGARLGIPFARIRLRQGDSDPLLTGGGTGGSRTMAASGTALAEASEIVIERGKAVAAHLLEADTHDIEFVRGRFLIAGTDRGIGLMELAERLRAGLDAPDLPRTLDVDHVSGDIPSAFPNGCHVAEVEIDPDTGRVDLVRYSSVNDFGTVINPLLVEGQIHGGVVQGIGQALFEHALYDADGQPVTGSFMDYALPRANDVTGIQVAHHPVPTGSNALGVKGCGEAGCAGALSAVMNAVVNALAPFGIRHIDMPATSERVWAAVRKASGEVRPE